MTSIMSTTGSPSLPLGKPEAMAVLVRPPVPERSAYVDQAVEIWRVIGSPGFPFDEQRIRARAAAHFDRGYHPPGIARQLVGVIASGNRTEALGKVSTSSLVIHGVDDPLVPVEAGKATAAAFPMRASSSSKAWGTTCRARSGGILRPTTAGARGS
jgi:pimeloyl-ACP methyl ester carboxylesterase